ncbi:hypothetical protein I5Q34_29715 [Streptomyces sp. AV19]|uniref:hypothetical protein n=1 Tax=Streptomyces sp. AV19 TaxID=2793068 RepID=UPI0018FE236C|nr:hypothetical protein [Streptomyces sp. AV19]MBH1938387.1 hypothetical protein [Streptomyces sp. AV19]MDG4535036.1 hypothetical protein [Streptomyces sp. AV19]
MHISRSRAAVAAACGAALVLTSVSAAEAAAPRQAPPAGAVLSGATEGGGYGAGPSAADLRRATADGALAAGITIPKCQGTYKMPIADVTLKESLKGGIPWQVGLGKKLNSNLGTVNFRTQIFADGHEVAGNGTQKQKWNYKFHGTVKRTFVRQDNKKKFTLQKGRVVSFFWNWHSAAKPNVEGYRYVICQFQP